MLVSLKRFPGGGVDGPAVPRAGRPSVLDCRTDARPWPDSDPPAAAEHVATVLLRFTASSYGPSPGLRPDPTCGGVPPPPPGATPHAVQRSGGSGGQDPGRPGRPLS